MKLKTKNGLKISALILFSVAVIAVAVVLKSVRQPCPTTDFAHKGAAAFLTSQQACVSVTRFA